MQISDEMVAEIHYRLTNAEGQLIDHSEQDQPLAYVHGKGNIIPGLERALDGKSKGDKFSLTLEPDDAYGGYDEALRQQVHRSEFTGVEELEVGMQFHAEFPSGKRVATVSALEGDQVTIDGNHPLAGETLSFDIEVAGVRQATQEELGHGHAHGPGGAH